MGEALLQIAVGMLVGGVFIGFHLWMEAVLKKAHSAWHREAARSLLHQTDAQHPLSVQDLEEAKRHSPTLPAHWFDAEEGSRVCRVCGKEAVWG